MKAAGACRFETHKAIGKRIVSSLFEEGHLACDEVEVKMSNREFALHVCPLDVADVLLSTEVGTIQDTANTLAMVMSRLEHRDRTDSRSSMNAMFDNNITGIEDCTQEHIGQGTYGFVWKVFSSAFAKDVAVKSISKAAHEKLARRSSSSRRPADEFEVLAKLSHPNILKAYSCYEDVAYLHVMCEYVASPTWFHVLDSEGPYAEQMTINLMRQASNAVAYMHNMNVIHRDIKPENALVCFRRPC